MLREVSQSRRTGHILHGPRAATFGDRDRTGAPGLGEERLSGSAAGGGDGTVWTRMVGTAAQQCEGAECHRTGALGAPAGRPHLPSQLSGPMLDIHRCRSGSLAPQPNTAHGALTGPARVQSGLQRLGQAPAHSDALPGQGRC